MLKEWWWREHFHDNFKKFSRLFYNPHFFITITSFSPQNYQVIGIFTTCLVFFLGFIVFPRHQCGMLVVRPHKHRSLDFEDSNLKVRLRKFDFEGKNSKFWLRKLNFESLASNVWLRTFDLEGSISNAS